jgi:hypothetical protein
MKLSTVWCVTDPGPRSEIGEVLWLATPEKIINCAIGCFAAGEAPLNGMLRGLTIYTTEAEARADAEARLAKRDGRTA